MAADLIECIYDKQQKNQMKLGKYKNKQINKKIVPSARDPILISMESCSRRPPTKLDLGIIIDNKLNWNGYIQETIKKFNQISDSTNYYYTNPCSMLST